MTIWMAALALLLGTTCTAASKIEEHHTYQAEERGTAGAGADSFPAARPFVKHLPQDTVHHLPLLEPPLSRVLQAGWVTHTPGRSGREHSTKSYEEMLVVLSGQGELVIGGSEPLALGARDVAYIPPHTTHFVRNTGPEPLQYIYIVADTGAKP